MTIIISEYAFAFSKMWSICVVLSREAVGALEKGVSFSGNFSEKKKISVK
jgi:hypothetical protein